MGACQGGSDEYWPAESAEEKFIHFSFKHQIVAVANRLFHGREDLILLEVDAGNVTSDVVVEGLDLTAEKFPHLYRPLKISEVIVEHNFQPSEDGSFKLAF